MFELKKLWRGQISPGERHIHPDSAYHIVSNAHSKELDILYKMLSPEAIRQYEKAEQLWLDMVNIDEEETFIEGFRMGARMMLDILRDYRGTYYTPASEWRRTPDWKMNFKGEIFIFYMGVGKIPLSSKFVKGYKYEH